MEAKVISKGMAFLFCQGGKHFKDQMHGDCGGVALCAPLTDGLASLHLWAASRPVSGLCERQTSKADVGMGASLLFQGESHGVENLAG